MEPLQNKNETVRLAISYSTEQEVQRAQWTAKRLPWYAEQGYAVDRIKLPNGVTGSSGDEDIARAVRSEYTDTDYLAAAAKLQHEWETISGGFEKMKSESAFHLQNKYEVVLTKYGMGGSYNATLNQVTVKLGAKAQGGIAGVVAHEIVHMTIQYLIDQYQVRHWRKERLVDLLMEHYFPGLKKMQIMREDVSVVDQAFQNHFPDIEAIARAIGEVVG